MKNGRELKMIGDYIGTIEEFLPGEGTFADDGKIYASNIGRVIIDKENHIARIDCKLPAELKNNDIVFGEVISVNKNGIMIILRKILGVKGSIEVKAGIHVSNISGRYVKNPEELFGIGDIVKARVIRVGQGVVDLSTKGNLGVVKAFCKRCRAPLLRLRRDNMLICNRCNNRERRKIATDYGNVFEL
ncbi:MAG: RNA-binding protein [Candidatus Altiarchaeales archaeon]|nr:MAG: RNA-binding protein [Candidatus Altiarchaeales archaeon]RLI94008.1 MAG: RNA-binding protein [Candidatus Altiarchaeales archaeon]